MANEQNLRPGEYKLSKEEVRKGGIASGIARRKKKMIRENLEYLLGLSIKDTKTKATLKALGVEDEEMTNQMAMTIAMYKQALKGDVSAFNSIRDTIGQKPVEVQEVREVPKIIDDID